MLHPLRSRHNPYNYAARVLLRIIVIGVIAITVRYITGLQNDAQAANEDTRAVLACLNGQPLTSEPDRLGNVEFVHCQVRSEVVGKVIVP